MGVVKFSSLTDEADSGCYCGSMTEPEGGMVQMSNAVSFVSE